MDINTQSKSSIDFDFSVSLPLCFKLVRTSASKQFISDLNKPWKGADKIGNIKVIQLKCQARMKKVLDDFNKHYVIENIEEYLNVIADISNTKLLSNGEQPPSSQQVGSERGFWQ